MTGYVSLNRLFRLACTLRSVDDADAALLGKLLKTFVREFREEKRPSRAPEDPLGQPMVFAQADTHPVLSAVTLRLRRRLGDDICGAWILKLRFVEERAGVVSLATPNKFVADHVSTQFGDALLSAWRAEQVGIMGMKIAADTAVCMRSNQARASARCTDGRQIQARDLLCRCVTK
jgi:hypothetical protein